MSGDRSYERRSELLKKAKDIFDPNHILIVAKKKKYIKEGLLVDDDADSGTGETFEGGHMDYLESVGLYNQRDPSD